MTITMKHYNEGKEIIETIVVSEDKAKIIRKKIEYLKLKKEERLKQIREDFKNGKFDHVFK